MTDPANSFDNSVVRPFDFVFYGPRRIALIKPGEATNDSPANIGHGMYTVSLHSQTVTVVVRPDRSFHVPRQRIVEIAQAVGERIQATEHFEAAVYEAAAKLLDEEGRYIDANRLFTDPTEPMLRYIFDVVMEEMYPDDAPGSYETAHVAYLAIFSEFMTD